MNISIKQKLSERLILIFISWVNEKTFQLEISKRFSPKWDRKAYFLCNLSFDMTGKSSRNSPIYHSEKIAKSMFSERELLNSLYHRKKNRKEIVPYHKAKIASNYHKNDSVLSCIPKIPVLMANFALSSSFHEFSCEQTSSNDRWTLCHRSHTEKASHPCECGDDFWGRLSDWSVLNKYCIQRASSPRGESFHHTWFSAHCIQKASKHRALAYDAEHDIFAWMPFDICHTWKLFLLYGLHCDDLNHQFWQISFHTWCMKSFGFPYE